MSLQSEVLYLNKKYMSKRYDNNKRNSITKIINNIQIYKCLYDIGKIISVDANVKKGASYTNNNNGFYIMSNKLTDATFAKLDTYTKTTLKKEEKKYAKTKSQNNSIFDTITENGDDTQSEDGVKLSSKEKKFIKKIQFNS